MGQIGFSEMLVIFVVALLVFGPKKLPELGKSLGKGIREFRKATNELKSTWEDQVKDIQAPLNDVKRDISSVGQDLKSDFYKSLEEEPHPPLALPEAAAGVAPETQDAPLPGESPVPKEHV